jgi:hypothetical protein
MGYRFVCWFAFFSFFIYVPSPPLPAGREKNVEGG